jgi:hypothetical protein
MDIQMSNEIVSELIANKMKHAFMGFSIYEDVLLPVYDLSVCLETFAENGVSEEEAIAIISGDDWIKQFGSVKPIFWLGTPEVEHQTMH